MLQRREEQDAELAALRARLAGEFDAGATSGSRAAQEQGAELAAQLAEARQRCGEYAAEAESLRAQAAQLAGARDGAEAALQAAAAELEAVKALLVQQEAGSGELGGAQGSSGIGGSALMAQLEEQNRQLSARLEALQAGAERHQEGAAGAAGQLAELQQVSEGNWALERVQSCKYRGCSGRGEAVLSMEKPAATCRNVHTCLAHPIPACSVMQENERLVELLGHMDAERSRLAAQLAEVRADLVRLRATAPEPAAPAAAAAARHASGAAAQQAQQQVARLESALADEGQRRQQAERDFQVGEQMRNALFCWPTVPLMRTFLLYSAASFMVSPHDLSTDHRAGAAGQHGPAAVTLAHGFIRQRLRRRRAPGGSAAGAAGRERGPAC